MELIKNVIFGLTFQCIIGFFAWTFWQIAVSYIPALPSIPLMAGISLWVLLFMCLYVPIFLAVYVANITSRKPMTTTVSVDATTK